jgi:hypothetical protein
MLDEDPSDSAAAVSSAASSSLSVCSPPSASPVSVISASTSAAAVSAPSPSEQSTVLSSVNSPFALARGIADSDDYPVSEHHSIAVADAKDLAPDQGRSAIAKLLEVEELNEVRPATSSKRTRTDVHIQCSQFASQYCDGFWESAFPFCFAFGTGGPSQKRPVKIGKEALFKHLGELSSAVFQDPWWCLHAYNMIARTKMSRVTHVQSKRKLENFARLEVHEMKAVSDYMAQSSAALANGKRVPDITKKYAKHIVEFVHSVQHVTRGALHTRSAIDYERAKIFSMNYAFGTPHLWYVFFFLF